MHVNKSILIAGAAAILFLTAALAFFVGQSSQGAFVSNPQSQSAAEQGESKDLQTSLKEPDPEEIKPPTEQKSAETAEQRTLRLKTDEVATTNQPAPFSSSEEKLIDDWAEANEMCRGSPDEESIQIWCPRRDEATAKMNRAGICFGHEDDESAADHDIHRCRSGSYR